MCKLTTSAILLGDVAQDLRSSIKVLPSTLAEHVKPAGNVHLNCLASLVCTVHMQHHREQLVGTSANWQEAGGPLSFSGISILCLGVLVIFH
eukprot:5251645-Ditylum_brightwellii.AAC.1